MRYIGKGRNERLYTHLIEAKRSAAQPSPDTSGLYLRPHRKLVEAVRAGSQITEIVIISDLTDWEAFHRPGRTHPPHHDAPWATNGGPLVLHTRQRTHSPHLRSS